MFEKNLERNAMQQKSGGLEEGILKKQEKEILEDSVKLEQAEKDLSDFEAKVDEEFIAHYIKNIPESDRDFIEVGDLDTEGDDLEAKLKLILAARTAFVDEVVESRRGELAKLKESLEAKKADYQNNQVAVAFSKAHPEVDMQDFGKFITEHITPAEHQSFVEKSAGDGLKYFELVYEKYKKFKGLEKNDSDEDDLPPDLDELGTGKNEKAEKKPKTLFSDRKF